MIKKVRVSPSIIAVDYNDTQKLESALQMLKKTRNPLLHLDVMDGKFVPEKNLGIEFVSKMQEETDFILDVHLMVENPETVIDEYIRVGADILTIHSEAVGDLASVLQKIKSSGVLAGVAIKLDTSIDEIKDYIKKDLIDVVLVMSVEPGACGRAFNEKALAKIRSLRKLSSRLEIEVDGGINLQNISSVVDAGANIVVSGSAIFGASDPRKVIKEMRGYRCRV